MRVPTDYPSVVGIYSSQSILVYDARFKPIDAVSAESPIGIVRRVTGPKHVEYYLLVSARWNHNTTERAYIRASAVRIVNNPWDDIPHHSRLHTLIRDGAAAARRAVKPRNTENPMDAEPDD